MFFVCDFQVDKPDFLSFKLGLRCFVILGLFGRWCREDFLRFLYVFFAKLRVLNISDVSSFLKIWMWLFWVDNFFFMI